MVIFSASVIVSAGIKSVPMHPEHTSSHLHHKPSIAKSEGNSWNYWMPTTHLSFLLSSNWLPCGYWWPEMLWGLWDWNPAADHSRFEQAMLPHAFLHPAGVKNRYCIGRYKPAFWLLYLTLLFFFSTHNHQPVLESSPKIWVPHVQVHTVHFEIGSQFCLKKTERKGPTFSLFMPSLLDLSKQIWPCIVMSFVFCTPRWDLYLL